MRVISHLSSHNLYGNFKVLSPDGDLMFRCQEKRIQWYLKRNLATRIDDKTIKVNFTPKGKGNHGSDHMLSSRDNICVNCGTDQRLSRHHVVPYAFRKNMSTDYRDRNFHDVVLLCRNCHDQYELRAKDLMKEIQKDIPDNTNHLTFLRKLANISINDKIPFNKRLESMNLLLELFGDTLLDHFDRIILPIDGNNRFIQILNRYDEEEFVRMWRSHFVKHLKLDYLPPSWNINNPVYKNKK